MDEPKVNVSYVEPIRVVRAVCMATGEPTTVEYAEVLAVAEPPAQKMTGGEG